MRRFALIAVTALAWLLLSATANATFGGENGKIVFERNSASFGCNGELFTVNPDGSGTTSISPDPSSGGHLPTWSPDGKRLALAAQPTGSCTSTGIWVENADGSGRHKITPDAVPYNNAPAWAPTGLEIAFETSRDPLSNPSCGNARDLYVMNDDGTSPRRLTADDNIDAQPDWSPTKDRIVYSKTFVGFDEFCTPVNFGGGTYLINQDGTDERQIDISGKDYSWSPDRTRIAYRDGPGDIWVSQVGSFSACCAVDLTNTPSDTEQQPTWSPDGTQIAYARGSAIWVMNADGSNQHPITSGSSVDRNPDWQPVPRTYVRPRGATPIRVPLVPAYQQCTSSNSTHGAPLSFPSCAPPAPSSNTVFVGSGDSPTAAPARSIGFVRLDAVISTPGPPNDSDINVHASITNVMHTSDRSDYTGELRLEFPIRLTDRRNSPAFDSPGTVRDFSLFATIPCTATPDPTTGATCAVSTSYTAIIGADLFDGAKEIWELGQIKVHDGGPDEDADTTGDNQLFEVQGVFVP